MSGRAVPCTGHGSVLSYGALSRTAPPVSVPFLDWIVLLCFYVYGWYGALCSGVPPDLVCGGVPRPIRLGPAGPLDREGGWSGFLLPVLGEAAADPTISA